MSRQYLGASVSNVDDGSEALPTDDRRVPSQEHIR